MKRGPKHSIQFGQKRKATSSWRVAMSNSSDGVPDASVTLGGTYDASVYPTEKVPLNLGIIVGVCLCSCTGRQQRKHTGTSPCEGNG